VESWRIRSSYGRHAGWAAVSFGKLGGSITLKQTDSGTVSIVASKINGPTVVRFVG
jgi:hypothetical protein